MILVRVVDSKVMFLVNVIGANVIKHKRLRFVVDLLVKMSYTLPCNGSCSLAVIIIIIGGILHPSFFCFCRSCS